MYKPDFQLPDELQDLIRNRKCIAFIGSGPSIPSYGSWSKLINDLCEYCGLPNNDYENTTPDRLIDFAQKAKESNEDKYYEFLGTHFGRIPEIISPLYDPLISLPFSSYLTLNFDALIQKKGREAKDPCEIIPESYPSLDRIKMQNRAVHYLHGYIEEHSNKAPKFIVLARSEFDKAYSNGSNLMNFLLSVLENENIVFIGCTLREPRMEEVFQIANRNRKERENAVIKDGEQVAHPPKRYILLPDPQPSDSDGNILTEKMNEIKETDRKYYEGMRVNPYWYKVIHNGHSNLTYSLEQLLEYNKSIPEHDWSGGNLI